MSSIKIKNFGPIEEGFNENDGFLPIDKLMIFIGGQGSGKSSVVKLISTLTWIEKSLSKGSISIKDVAENDAFKIVWCEYQSIQNYFKLDSYIEYKGESIHFKYDSSKVEIQIKDEANYEQSKITYIPAERNFLSVLEDLENVKGLPKSLSWALEEYVKACRSLKNSILIHINDIKFEYDRITKTSSISGTGFDKLKLSEASSGIQSVAPLVLVITYLHYFINSQKANNIDNLSFAEREKYKLLEAKIDFNTDLTAEESEKSITNLRKKFLPQNLFTIIEEIEQNLFPESQKNILFKSFEFNNNNKNNNNLIITTHSPYIIAYTTLAMKAFALHEKAKNNQVILDKIDKVVPLKAIIDHSKAGIYQIGKNGAIFSIKSERGLIEDNNYLNDSLEETNELFDVLLDIEELCK